MNPRESVVQAALVHVHSLFPDVVQVFFGINGHWLYCDDVFDAPTFSDSPSDIDIDLLNAACEAAGEDKGFPCAYRLQDMEP